MFAQGTFNSKDSAVLTGASYDLVLPYHLPAACPSHSDNVHTCLFNQNMA